MSRTCLTQHGVERLKPKRNVYHIRDTELKGFGIRVLPSGGKRYFLHSQHQGHRVWKHIGDVDAMTEPEARARATSVLASIRNAERGIDVLPEQIVFERVAEEVFQRYQRHWKPATLKVNRSYYRNQILPWFKGRPIADITRHDVQQWFASLHETPVAADRSAPVLSVIMTQAEVYGYRPQASNPCLGIKRYRRGGRERFLSSDELHRLSGVLERHEGAHPLPSAAVRLLLLTGCRKGEVLTLKWSYYREGKLFLPDGNAGPRTVWLSSPARQVLDGLPRRTGWVFPAKRKPGPLSSIDHFWYRVRAEANLGDVRLHDLRHTYASVALLHGETVLAIGKLLGHHDPATTLKYIHLSDAAVRNAVKAVAPVLAGEG